MGNDREELAVEVEFAFQSKRVWECMDCCLKPEDVADFILAREQGLKAEHLKVLEAIKGELRKAHTSDYKLGYLMNKIDNALFIIDESLGKMKGE
jgi:hypothetical protein